MYLTLSLQFVATTAACALLWFFWRAIARESRFAGNVVAAGFLLRAFGSIGAFVISWCRLPIARSLQLGNGLWFYALDGQGYFRMANRIADTGIVSYFTMPSFPNKVFLFPVTLSLVLFGKVTSSVFLLNLFSYLGASWILVRMGHRGGGADVALLLYALSPGMILWSTQMLKDTLFVFLVLLLIFEWQRSIEAATQGRWRRFALAGSLFVLAVALASGVRPYFGLIVWIAVLLAVPFYMLATAKGARFRILSIFIFLVVAMVVVSIAGMATFVPSAPSRGRHGAAWTSARKVGRLDVLRSRERFDLVGGNSTIDAGLLIRKLEGGGDKSHKLHSPRTMPGRVLAGIAAATTPRAIAQPLLEIVGGGRGLWAFAEVDTLYFALLLVASLAVTFREGPFRNPDLAMASILTAGVAFPMVYAVSNFGSLFRLRGIVLALLLGMLASCRRFSSPPVSEVVPNQSDHVQNVERVELNEREAGTHLDAG